MNIPQQCLAVIQCVSGKIVPTPSNNANDHWAILGHFNHSRSQKKWSNCVPTSDDVQWIPGTLNTPSHLLFVEITRQVCRKQQQGFPIPVVILYNEKGKNNRRIWRKWFYLVDSAWMLLLGIIISPSFKTGYKYNVRQPVKIHKQLPRGALLSTPPISNYLQNSFVLSAAKRTNRPPIGS